MQTFIAPGSARINDRRGQSGRASFALVSQNFSSSAWVVPPEPDSVWVRPNEPLRFGLTRRWLAESKQYHVQAHWAKKSHWRHLFTEPS